jgi:hypothetical protein
METINGYVIMYNALWRKWIVDHPIIGVGIAEFITRQEAVDYCMKG